MTLLECMEWCMEKYSEALEAGRDADASAYQQLYSLWSNRHKESTK